MIYNNPPPQIITSLLTAAPNWEGDSGRMLKTTVVVPTFPTMVQEPENMFNDIDS